MLLSIIIVNYQSIKLTLRCLKSILGSGLDFNYEVILIDNNSTENLAESIKNWKGIKGIKSRIIVNSVNVGFAKAVNQGIRKAKGEYVLLLNPDTIVKKRAINKLMEFAQGSDDAGVVGAKLLNKNGSVQASVYHFPTIGRAFGEFWLGKGGAYQKYAPKENRPVAVDAVVGAVFLITPRAIRKVGLLNPRYFMYFEDLDYCRRVKRAGLSVYYLPESEVIHLHGQSGKELAGAQDQWRRLVPSSKLYHGLINHYLINFTIWLGVKLRRGNN